MSSTLKDGAQVNKLVDPTGDTCVLIVQKTAVTLMLVCGLGAVLVVLLVRACVCIVLLLLDRYVCCCCCRGRHMQTVSIPAFQHGYLPTQQLLGRVQGSASRLPPRPNPLLCHPCTLLLPQEHALVLPAPGLSCLEGHVLQHLAGSCILCCLNGAASTHKHCHTGVGARNVQGSCLNITNSASLQEIRQTEQQQEQHTHKYWHTRSWCHYSIPSWCMCRPRLVQGVEAVGVDTEGASSCVLTDCVLTDCECFTSPTAPVCRDIIQAAGQNGTEIEQHTHQYKQGLGLQTVWVL